MNAHDVIALLRNTSDCRHMKGVQPRQDAPSLLSIID